MNNEYKTSEVVEIGRAEDVILGGKGSSNIDEATQALGESDEFDE
ncbi:MAG TPA: hypothetical protein VI750_03120 [Pyrinomonadaceae bacterium]|nr:hypothetical protein [Pyrinomonadaceae bacterium]HLE62100.1 hypothetical protein [Pyrinomonadaceae bacterium]